jgi:hypothetical protein
MRNLCTVLTALFFVDRAPTWYGDFFMKITEASIVTSSAFHSSHASSDARVQKQYDEWVARVLKSRVKFAAGSDMCWFLLERRAPRQAPRPCLTCVPPECRRSTLFVRSPSMRRKCWAGRTASALIEPGKFADLVAVGGELIADIIEIERVRFGMKDGQVGGNDLTAHGSARSTQGTIYHSIQRRNLP